MPSPRPWWILVLIALLVIVIAGTWLFVIPAERLHPNPQAIPSVTQTQPPPEWSEPVRTARQSIRAALSNQNLPGLSVAVAAGGSIVWSEGFGWADIETRAPVTPDTPFRIGTTSTILTSAAIGVLLDKGRLKLDDEIQTYVPQYPRKQWPLTLRHVMANTGGVATSESDDGPLSRHRCEQPAQALEYFAQDPLLFEPGTQYRRSDYGWILASAAVETQAQQPFLTFLREQIFHPLGMTNTGAESAAKENPERIGEPEEDPPFMSFIHQVMLKPLGIGRPKSKPPTDPATIYVPGFGYHPLIQYRLHLMALRNLSCYAGSMAFLSTPTDLVRFTQAINQGKLLNPETARLLTTSQQLTSGQETGYGLGWDLDNVTLSGKPAQTIGDNGELLGRRAVSLMTFPEAGLIVAVTSNAAYTDPATLARKIAEPFTPAVPQ